MKCTLRCTRIFFGTLFFDTGENYRSKSMSSRSFPPIPTLLAMVKPISMSRRLRQSAPVGGVVGQFDPIADDLRTRVEAALQAMTNMKVGRRRESATKAGSFGDVLNEIEREVSKLDQWQKQAAIESPDGPQRVRGLGRLWKNHRSRIEGGIFACDESRLDDCVTFHTPISIPAVHRP